MQNKNRHKLILEVFSKMKLILIFVVLFIALLSFKFWTIRYYDGPISNHYDGNIFHNPGSNHTKSYFEILKWQFTRHKPQWPDVKPAAKLDLPPKAVTDDSFRISMVGHSTVLIQSKGINILTDPIWSLRASPFQWIGPKRSILPGIEFAALPKIDVVIVSHNHYDHMDETTIKRLFKEHNPLFITPLGNDTLLKRMEPDIRVKTLDWYENAVIGDSSTNIWCYPAQHWSRRWLTDQNKALWGAFIIETPSGNIYFAGDTGYGTGEHFKAAQRQFKEFKVALLPIGAFEPEWFMAYSHINPQEAIQAMQDLKAQHSIALHFQTFHIADDTFDEPVTVLKDALKKHPQLDFKILNAGEKFIFD
jgi:L-ascorbate metabolism protein UlaG (beta-lactamase superfamily)